MGVINQRVLSKCFKIRLLEGSIAGRSALLEVVAAWLGGAALEG